MTVAQFEAVSAEVLERGTPGLTAEGVFAEVLQTGTASLQNLASFTEVLLPVAPSTAPKGPLKGMTNRINIGGGSTYAFSPNTAPIGTPIATGDYLIAVFSAAGSPARVPTLGTGWTEIMPYQTVGSAMFGVWLRLRGVGDSYIDALTTATNTTWCQMFWGDGANVDPELDDLVIGATKLRASAPTESLTSTALSVATKVANSLAISICLERTTAAETDITSITPEWLVDYYSIAAATDSTYTVAHRSYPSIGSTGDCVVTFLNSQANNGAGVMFVLPPPHTPYRPVYDSSGVEHQVYSFDGVNTKLTVFG